MLKMLKYLNIKQCPVTVCWTAVNTPLALVSLSSWFRTTWYDALLVTTFGCLTTFWTYALVYRSIEREHLTKDAEDAFEQALKEKVPKKVGNDYFL